MWPQTLGYVVEALVALAILTGIVFVAIRKARLDEALKTVEWRGARIQDLEDHIIRLETRIVKLEAFQEATAALKAEEIADRVAEKLTSILEEVLR